MRNIKQFLRQFLASLGVHLDVNAMRESYECANDCFCRKKNQSKGERLRTYHLFCKMRLPGVLANFTVLTEDLISRARRQLATVATDKSQRLNAKYGQLKKRNQG
jgi:hypothetical protein